MNWERLNKSEQLEQIKIDSKQKPVIIFKHSTSCSISRMVLDRLERNWNVDEMKGANCYLLDLHSYRGISNKIAEEFHVVHESPQVLIIKNGNAVYTNSHMGISYKELVEQIKN